MWKLDQSNPLQIFYKLINKAGKTEKHLKSGSPYLEHSNEWYKISPLKTIFIEIWKKGNQYHFAT